MLVYLLFALLGIWVCNYIHRTSLKEAGKVMNYLLPYWEQGDRGDKILGIFQLIMIGGISIFEAATSRNLEEQLIIFSVVFMSLIWFIKLVMILVEWLSNYIKQMPVNVIFTFIIPIIVGSNIGRMKSQLEIHACLVALLMSVMIVYMELILLVIGRGSSSKVHRPMRMSRSMKIKSILTWFFIILINLYTLLLFIQFNISSETWHFINAQTLSKESAVDLLYYLIITFTTVGLGDIQPHTLTAKLVTVLIAASGMLFTGLFAAAILTLDEQRKS